MFKATVTSKTDLTDQAKWLSQGGNSDTSQFGPGKPLPDTPLGGDPRQFQYRPSFNITPPQSDRRVDPEVLRLLAREYDLLARCLSRRKEELRTLHWSIQPRERRNKKKMREIQEKNAKAIEDITEFFRHPEAFMDKVNGKYIRYPLNDYQSWLNALLDDKFIVGAMAIYPRRKLNGELLSLERIDAATIKVLLDDSGRTPIPPNPAYQQWLYGVPREDFTAKELIYKVYNPTNDTPYGFSLVEQILAHVQMAMRNEAFISSYFQDGSIPPLLFTVPESWTVEQMLEFADIMNARLSGNPKALREFNIVPNGTEKLDLKPFDFDDAWTNYVATMTCVLCGVQPTEMGIVPQKSGLGGKSFGEAASDIHDKQVTFVSEFLQSVFTDIIKYHFGNDDLVFIFDHMLEREEKERAEINQTLIMSGQKSIDQILVENGEEPEGINRFVVVGDRVFFLPDLVAGSVKGSVAVNLGAIGGVPMPDDTFTQDVPLTQDAPGANVVTPNPNQTSDPSAKLDTSHTEPPDENKSAPPKPPKQPEGTSYPTGPTVNTAKSVDADVIKASSDDKKQKRETHQQEMVFIAAYLALAKKVHWHENYVSPDLVQAAFKMTHLKQQQLAEAIYELKKEVYIESYNKMARADGNETIDDVDHHTEVELRRQASEVAKQVANTHNDDLQRQVDKLVAAGLTTKQLLDALNDWQKQRNMWKPEQIAATEISKPWNDAVFAYDRAMDRTDSRKYYVKPDYCKCANCQSMVNGNPYTYDQAYALPIPNHPNCVHFIVSADE